MKRWILLISCLNAFSLSADVTFGGLHLSDSDQLLFHADVIAPVYGEYRTLFTVDLPRQRMRQLTFFPERVTLVEGGEKLQIENRFGIFRTGRSFFNLYAVNGFSSFENGSEIKNAKLPNVETSPNGLYLLYQRPSGYAYADLVLLSVRDMKEVVISTDNEFSLDNTFATWSPDSTYFIYSKKGSVYYFSVNQLENSRFISEEFRSIGEGGIASVKWSSINELYYINQYRIYKINSREFFTQSKVAEIFSIGAIIGKIPFEFNYNFDSFYISPDEKKILLNKGGRNLLLYFLKIDDYHFTDNIKSLPYLFLPKIASIKRVIWSEKGLVTILATFIFDGDFNSSIFRMDVLEKNNTLEFSQLEDIGVEDIVLSEDEKTIALMKEDGVELKNYTTWVYIKKITHPEPLHIIWRNNKELIVSGAYYTELINTKSNAHSIVALSQSGDHGYGEDGFIYTSFNGFNNRLSGNTSWSSTGEIKLLDPLLSSSKKRVYLESIIQGSYKNSIMVRSRDENDLGTKTLFSPPKTLYEPFQEEEAWDLKNFTHGSRTRSREVSLVFNAIDSEEGLKEILTSLSEYNIRATFFINGEFMRRNPEAVKELSLSEHEIGSMFYLYFNMTDDRFNVDKNFVQKGLAKNEDDYFLLTGKELSLLWHSPYYFVNSDIIDASAAIEYSYIGRDVEPQDWVSLSNSAGDSSYISTMDIIENIMSDKKQGSIIPIRIGRATLERDDYLFQNIDLLINALITQGYDIVPVTTLIEHTQ